MRIKNDKPTKSNNQQNREDKEDGRKRHQAKSNNMYINGTLIIHLKVMTQQPYHN